MFVFSPSFSVAFVFLFFFVVRFLVDQLSFEVVLPVVVAFLFLTYWTKFIHIIIAFIINALLAIIVVKLVSVVRCYKFFVFHYYSLPS
jgi:hypothetical protein